MSCSCGFLFQLFIRSERFVPRLLENMTSKELGSTRSLQRKGEESFREKGKKLDLKKWRRDI